VDDSVLAPGRHVAEFKSIFEYFVAPVHDSASRHGELEGANGETGKAGGRDRRKKEEKEAEEKPMTKK